MGEERWLTVWELFSCVYDMPAQERAAFLESNSPGPEVRGQVLALLEVSQSCTQEDSVFLPPAPGPEYPVGHQLGRYMIVGLIGQGGFGRIYAAHDKDLDRVVALKVLSRPLAGNRDRQIEEARAASALNHPNIVTVYEAISADDHVAIAMEFVDGQSLRQMLNETAGPVALEKVIRYGRQMAEALKAAHEAGITHRDVKPENILVRKDQYVKLVDFGLATHLVTSPDTGAGGLTGTLRYISPERLRGEPSSRASDIFALGLVLYEMTAGVHAFPGKTPLDAAAAIAATDPLPPSGRRHTFRHSWTGSLWRCCTRTRGRVPRPSKLLER
jgi:serine/threonine protein kinase